MLGTNLDFVPFNLLITLQKATRPNSNIERRLCGSHDCAMIISPDTTLTAATGHRVKHISLKANHVVQAIVVRVTISLAEPKWQSQVISNRGQQRKIKRCRASNGPRHGGSRSGNWGRRQNHLSRPVLRTVVNRGLRIPLQGLQVRHQDRALHTSGSRISRYQRTSPSPAQPGTVSNISLWKQIKSSKQSSSEESGEIIMN